MKRFYYLQVISALLGINLSLYLLAQHTRLKSGIQGEGSFCSLGKYADCDIVNSSQFSEILGFPLASLGAIFFFVLLALVVMSPPNSKTFRRTQWMVAVLSVVGLVADLGLLVVQLTAIHSLCLLCLFTYVCNLGVLAGGLGLAGKGRLKARFRTLFRGEGPYPEGPVVGLALLAFVSYATMVILLPNTIRIHSNKYSMVNQAIENFFAKWGDQKAEAIDWKELDGIKGTPDSPIQIVEFSDFECPHCQRAAFTLHNALTPFKDRVFFIFKHFPLDSSCNPALNYKLHPNACSLARLATCARQKGQFWEFHDFVFLRMNRQALKSGFKEVSNEIVGAGIFTQPEIDACLEDETSMKNVAEDIELGRELGVRGTPAIYINGKKVSIPLTVDSVRKLLEFEDKSGRP